MRLPGLLYNFLHHFVIFLDYREPKLIGMILNFLMIPSIITAPSCAALFPILVHNVDPTYFWFRNIPFFSKYSKLTVIIRMAIIYITILHGCVLVNSTIITSVNICLMLNSDLNKLTKRDKVHNFPKTLRKYRQLQLMMTITNQVVEYLLTAALLTYFVCFVMIGYIVVRLSNLIPMAMTLLCVAFIVFFLAFVHTILPLPIRGLERSEEFVRNGDMENLQKLERKELKSCSVLRLRIGPYTTLTKAFRTNFFSFVVYHTVNLIIIL